MSAGRSTNQSEAPLRLSAGTSNSLKSYTPTQLHFLMRLSHLQRQRRETVNVLEPGDWRMRLINKALYSTYTDCVELGLGEEAKLLMSQNSEAPEKS